MILKASQRGGAKQLALHLLKTEENEHVELHELRGFVSDDIAEAFKEAYAVSRGTRCQQFLFSVSLNPPQNESVSVDVFEGAISAIEQKLGLVDQPRAIVFHEKEGRRHAHCVWSRIDAEEMKAVNLSHYKMKLRDISRELYLENGWQMPRGLVDSRERDPANFSLAEWQQAKRAEQAPKALKAMFQECWAISDSSAAFASALKERGYHLARGDRRGFVAVDFKGEIYAIARWTGKRTKEVNARLGNPETLPSVADVKRDIARNMTGALERHIKSVQTERQAMAAPLMEIRRRMSARHREERTKLKDKQEARWTEETRQRAARLPRGLKGLWTRIIGKYSKIRQQNEHETTQSLRRDRFEQQALVDRQLDDRRILQRQIKQVQRTTSRELTELHRDVEHYMGMGAESPLSLRSAFRDVGSSSRRIQPIRRRMDRDDGPSM